MRVMLNEGATTNLSKEEINNVLNLWDSGYMFSGIAKRVNLHPRTVKRIIDNYRPTEIE